MTQGEVILLAARRRWPRSRQLRIVEHDDFPGQWFLHDPESKLWWEAVPAGGARDASGYARPDTVAFWPIVWRAGRTREEALRAEMASSLPAEEQGADWGDW